VLSEPTKDVVCGHDICCGLGAAKGNVWCWGPFAPHELAFAQGGAVVTGVVALKAGPRDTMYGRKSDLSLLVWDYYTRPEPVTHQKQAVTAPHYMGEGCVITNIGEHLSPTSTWVPFCE
jgi:hypothetical protein